jgi:hypothetical protein
MKNLEMLKNETFQAKKKNVSEFLEYGEFSNHWCQQLP